MLTSKHVIAAGAIIILSYIIFKKSKKNNGPINVKFRKDENVRVLCSKCMHKRPEANIWHDGIYLGYINDKHYVKIIPHHCVLTVDENMIETSPENLNVENQKPNLILGQTTQRSEHSIDYENHNPIENTDKEDQETNSDIPYLPSPPIKKFDGGPTLTSRIRSKNQEETVSHSDLTINDQEMPRAVVTSLQRKNQLHTNSIDSSPDLTMVKPKDESAIEEPFLQLAINVQNENKENQSNNESLEESNEIYQETDEPVLQLEISSTISNPENSSSNLRIDKPKVDAIKQNLSSYLENPYLSEFQETNLDKSCLDSLNSEEVITEQEIISSTEWEKQLEKTPENSSLWLLNQNGENQSKNENLEEISQKPDEPVLQLEIRSTITNPEDSSFDFLLNPKVEAFNENKLCDLENLNEYQETNLDETHLDSSNSKDVITEPNQLQTNQENCSPWVLKPKVETVNEPVLHREIYLPSEIEESFEETRRMPQNTDEPVLQLEIRLNDDLSLVNENVQGVVSHMGDPNHGSEVGSPSEQQPEKIEDLTQEKSDSEDLCTKDREAQNSTQEPYLLLEIHSKTDLLENDTEKMDESTTEWEMKFQEDTEEELESFNNEVNDEEQIDLEKLDGKQSTITSNNVHHIINIKPYPGLTFEDKYCLCSAQASTDSLEEVIHLLDQKQHLNALNQIYQCDNTANLAQITNLAENELQWQALYY